MQAVDALQPAAREHRSAALDFEGTRLSNGVMGMILVLMAETMFFAGLMSAFIVARSNVVDWPPEGQPRLSIARTAINTLVLCASAVPMGRALRRREDGRAAQRLVLITLLLGALFVGLQGVEWVRLLRFGLGARASVYGGFFYLVVGAHGAHALAGLVMLGAGALGWVRLRSLHVVAMYWFFVVGLWPFLYGLVYLS